MGGFCSSNDDNPPPIVEPELKFKLLLLGPGESGKSTVLKQLKSIYNVAPNEHDLDECKKALHQNTLECMKVLCDAAERFKYGLGDEDTKTAKWLQDEDVQYGDTAITAAQAKAIQKLFKSEAIQNAYARRDEFWILDACDYYVEHVPRFAAQDYAPDERDMVMCRIRTTGRVLDAKLKVKSQERGEGDPEFITYEIIDVGGQRNERKKWVQMLSNVKAIIFLVNLAGYNQVLYENKEINRMFEALEVFGKITGWRDESKTSTGAKNALRGGDLFKHLPIYLLLNKKDIFEKMIYKVGLDKTFPEYRGGSKSDEAIDFIKEQFQKRCPPGKNIMMLDITGVSRL
mmetsp:Transcript_18225/g.29691  ORF Transcript_18225/g.29691 Transcript_18225/m.29691 type:complete len:344 (+) Transcript_18225:121-1152(+)